MRTSKLVALLSSGALVLAACGSGDTTVEVSAPDSATAVTVDATTSAVTAAPTTTVAPAATAVSTTTATTVQATTATTMDAGEEPLGPVSRFSLAPVWAEPTADSGGANGSGCAPGTDLLPDGTWFGFAVEVGADAMQFDLACFFFGEIAWDEAAKVGEEAYNDFFIRNESDRLRTVAIDPATPMHWIDWAGNLELIVGTYDSWPAIVEPVGGSCPEWCPVWLLVNGGVVTDVVEQYIP